ncbi:HlyD family efflux transporter periplasmic adaptor subunit [Thermomonospora umbrina]|uniref:Putative peptidoglycan binding protein n=1 Tax=Thermomonospora umbrina TaxID=111806 RepID=A0A3D9SMB5_9ACTN|nr:HlyD family efflux transporter periplasmic adaptor subunit [Thermomonospora umbrina]REE96988.1 putative peptidoglycan binding protein [Thermomonospora umbrina]
MTSAPPIMRDDPGGRAGVPRGRARRRRRRALAVITAVLVASGAAAVAIAGPFEEPVKSAGTRSVAPTGEAEVTRGRLTARTSVSGTLGYVGGYTAVNQATGTFSRLPKPGRVIGQGGALYWVDGKPVILLRGSATSMYRDLKQGMTGADVRQLNAALLALGYGPRYGLSSQSMTYGWATTYAVKQLQDDLGVKEDGMFPKGQAVFLPRESIRVTKVHVSPGAVAAPGTPVLEGGSTTRQVTVEIDASLQSKVKKGDKVEITLPDQKTVPGRVTSVGTVARTAEKGGATITVRITPDDPKATGRLDQAPVGVSILTDSVDDALAVPVNALLALLDGGYGIEVIEPSGARTLVPVTLGLFDTTAGMVQISGKGVAAGRRVVVPAS